jgi:uncharacterized phage protein (TIGR01671 family)
MRTIKFRAWDKDKKCFIPTEKWAVVSTDFNAFGIMLEDWENYKEGEYFYSNSQELMQFTGLHDKNGREVYEGDVIGRKGFFNRVVIWYECGFATYSVNHRERIMPMTKESIDEFDEVIGNIHENPELL